MMNMTKYVDILLKEVAPKALTLVVEPIFMEFGSRYGNYYTVSPLYILTDTMRVKTSVLAYKLRLATIKMFDLKVGSTVAKQYKAIKPNIDQLRRKGIKQWVTLKIDINNPKEYKGHKYYDIKVSTMDADESKINETDTYKKTFEHPMNAMLYYRDLIFDQIDERWFTVDYDELK